MIKYKLISAFLLFLQLGCDAQSAEEFIKMAKDYNPGLKSLRLEYDAALLKADQVKDWPDPTVNIALGALPVETRLGAQRLRLGVTQMIPWKGTLNARQEVAQAMAEVKNNLDEVQEIDIEYAIRIAYRKLIYLSDQIAILEKHLEVLNALEDLAKSAVRSGNGKLSNVFFIERKREQLESDIKLLNKQKEQPTIMINRWAGRGLNTPIDLIYHDLSLITKKEVLDYSSNDHPSLKILDNKIKASQSTSAITKLESKPKIGVGLDYSLVTERSDVDIPNNGRDILMPMASISIPIHTNRYKAIRQEEIINQEAINSRSKELKDMFAAEIEMAFNLIEYQNQVIEKYKSLKKITAETIKLMRSEYAAEGTRFEELLRLEMELLDYDKMIIMAEFEKAMADAKIQKFKK